MYWLLGLDCSIQKCFVIFCIFSLVTEYKLLMMLGLIDFIFNRLSNYKFAYFAMEDKDSENEIKTVK